jgi:DNA repair exonuclease SbcCD ATPase subunit
MLAELRLWDFCGYAEAKLKLAKRGLVWIGGDNRDTKAATSNGAGKTTIFKGISWVAYGLTIDGERNHDPGDKVIREGTKRAKGELLLESGWLIRRERGKGQPRLALIQPDGAEWKGGSREEIQAKVTDLLGMDFHAFKNTVLYGQNDTARWASREVSDAKRKEMLHKLLRTEVLGTCHAVAKTKALAARTLAGQHQAEVSRLASMINAHDLDAHRARAETWDGDRRRRVEEGKAEVKRLKGEAEAVKAGAADLPELERQLAECHATIDAANKASEERDALEAGAAEGRSMLADLDRRMDAATNDAERARTQLKRLAGDQCPTCQAPLKDGAHAHTAKLIATLRAAEDKATQLARELQRKHTEQLDNVRSLEKRMGDLRRVASSAASSHAAARALSGQIRERREADARAEALLVRARDKVASLKELAASTNPHTAALEAATAKVAALEAQREERAAALEAASAEAAALDFWVRGFGAQGLPSFVLDSVMPYLTERANHYLETLADGDITMAFSTQRELKSDKGALRDEIAISWVIEGITDKAASGGQMRKMEIATDLALMDLAEAREGGGLTLFMADEILDGLDAEGTERVLGLLQELRARRSSVFVISHSSAMSELFERQITVVKEGGVASLIEG